MMKNLKNLAELKDLAIAFTKPITAYWPQADVTEELSLSVSENLEKGYDYNNGIVAFVSENILYVIPSTRKVMEILKKEGFSRKSMCVPFSNWDYPVEFKAHWEELISSAHEEHLAEFFSDCEAFSNKNGFGRLEERLLEKCFEMPSTGISVKHLLGGEEEMYFPLISAPILDCIAIERIGHFCTNNGTCVFVYRDGKTYVTRNWEVVQALIDAGYYKKDLFVPFSNGERIKDPKYAALWKDATSAA